MTYLFVKILVLCAITCHKVSPRLEIHMESAVFTDYDQIIFNKCTKHE
jgi:hypothetical protein